MHRRPAQILPRSFDSEPPSGVLSANRYFGYFFFFYAFTAAGGTSM